METRPLREIALERIDMFIEETQMPGWRLSKLATGSNKTLPRLRTGLGVELGSIEKIERFMAAERVRIAEAVAMLNANDETSEAELVAALAEARAAVAEEHGALSLEAA